MTKEYAPFGRDLDARLHPLFDLVREVEALGLDTRPAGGKSAIYSMLLTWRRLTRLCMHNLEL